MTDDFFTLIKYNKNELTTCQITFPSKDGLICHNWNNETFVRFFIITLKANHNYKSK